MKYALIIADGMADDPVASLGDRTPVEAAATPAMDAIAASGAIGLVNTIPEGMQPGSDVACMSIFGYDPSANFSGRGPLEAGGMGLDVGVDEYAFRCNIVTLDYAAGIMRDYSAGHISSEEGRAIVTSLAEKYRDEKRFSFHPGVSYRHLFKVKKKVLKGMPECTPPHDITDQPYAPHLPRGNGATLLSKIMQSTRDFLADHPVNKARAAAGKRTANSLWFWSGGTKPAFRSYRQRFGLAGGVISAVDLIRGIAFFAGLRTIPVPGITGYYDTNYAGKAEHAIRALAQDDLVIVHVEAPDEASHNGHPDEKVRAIENIDRHILGPVHAALKACGDYRIAVLPDHYTPLATRTHRAGAVPAALCGTGIAAGSAPGFSERAAAAGAFNIAHGHKFINYFLGRDE
ncbi:MAG: cofactor-independent phosphoglycerate mutase [Planctomycetota bacterium]